MKVIDNEQWIKRQFDSCELGNSLRTKRLQLVAAQMLSRPEQSLPKQNPEWADLKAAYRFFDNDRVTFDALAEQHWQQTRQTRPGRYLLISDTTEIDHCSHKATTGLGMIGDGNGRGMQFHHCMMYNSNEDQIEGSAGALINYRVRIPPGETLTQRLKRHRESLLWSILTAKVGSPPQGSQWIHVFDRGGDNFQAMCQIKLNACDWIIRAGKLKRNVILPSGDKVPLKEAVNDATVVGGYQLNLRSRRGVKARTAQLQVSVMQTIFPTPRHRSQWVANCGITELAVNVVLVEEVQAPKGVTPIRWILLTSLPTSTFEQAWQVIDDYEKRWLAEEYHKVLKTGCSVEAHALRTADRLEPLIGLVSIIGIRLFQLKLIGRNQPNAKASTHVPSSWLKCLKLARPKLKMTGMSVYTFFREVAKMGGFLGRKGDGEPGWQTVWHGYQRLHDILDALAIAGHI